MRAVSIQPSAISAVGCPRNLMAEH
jgi:hypothetical protein